MTLSARNHLKGTIEEIQLGDVLAHVTVRVGESVIESVITRRSAEESIGNCAYDVQVMFREKAGQAFRHDRVIVSEENSGSVHGSLSQRPNQWYLRRTHFARRVGVAGAGSRTCSRVRRNSGTHARSFCDFRHDARRASGELGPLIDTDQSQTFAVLDGAVETKPLPIIRDRHLRVAAGAEESDVGPRGSGMRDHIPQRLLRDPVEAERNF